MSAGLTLRAYMQDWAIKNRPMRGLRRPTATGRIECLSSGWIPDSTHCEVMRVFRSYCIGLACLNKDETCLCRSVESRAPRMNAGAPTKDCAASKKGSPQHSALSSAFSIQHSVVE